MSIWAFATPCKKDGFGDQPSLSPSPLPIPPFKYSYEEWANQKTFVAPLNIDGKLLMWGFQAREFSLMNLYPRGPSDPVIIKGVNPTTNCDKKIGCTIDKKVITEDVFDAILKST